MTDNLRMRNIVELWAHKPGVKDYRDGELLLRQKNTITDYLYRAMHRGVGVSSWRNNRFGADSASYIDWITFCDTTGPTYRVKAIKRHLEDSNSIHRHIATLLSGEGNGLSINRLYLGGYVGSSNTGISYSGASDIDLLVGPTSVVSPNLSICAMVNNASCVYSLYPDCDYDPENPDDTPETPYDFRVQYDTLTSTYHLYLPASPPTGAWANPQTCDMWGKWMASSNLPTNPFSSLNLSSPIPKTNAFQLTVAWILQFV